MGNFLVLIGTFAPALMALWFRWKEEGSTGIRELLSRMLKWQVARRWYAVAVTYMVVVKLTAALIHRLIAGSWPRFGTEPWYILAIAIVVSTPVQSGEELGWRGYALPRLAERMGFAWASVVVGVIWAAWHLPIFFIRGADKYGQSFPVWAAAVTAVSVAIAYVYAKTGGSLLLTMLMHASINNTSDIVPAAQAAAANPFSLNASLILWLTTALMWVAAAYLLSHMPKYK
ncbi:MAG TPA: CPBP family intramembrane glutamic endopeptidase [Terriglobales bacterium]|nr:CPBP family intramembrane glutamic endopeptidase [Terriglobales bacterium]